MISPKLNLPTPIEQISFRNQKLFLKRDDLIDRDFSGNKARKLYYYLDKEFADTKRLISYGSAQSNAMYSLSVLARRRGWEFEYFVDHIADYLKQNPHGNYAAAIANGMKLHTDEDMPEPSSTSLQIQEGGRQAEAEYGIEILASEIGQWQEANQIDELNIFLPSGTGTTALFLQKHTKATVFSCACVGGDEYLKEQFASLEPDTKLHPTLLQLEKKHHFAKLYKDNYKIWLELRQETGVEFDLLYDPLGWRVMMAHPQLWSKPLLYIHQGGILGNESMLPRYERKYPNL